jgi:hypothetical protein
METGGSGGGSGKKAGEPTRTSSRLVNGVVPGAPLASPSSAGSGANFIFTHSTRQVDAEQTPEEAELDAVVGHTRLPTFADYPHLPYIHATVKETL